MGIFLMNQGIDLSVRDSEGRCAIHSAAIQGDYFLIETILKKGSNVDAQDIAGWTPLHHGARVGDMATIEVLLANNADCSIRSKKNELPITVARRAHRIEAILPLLKAAFEGNRIEVRSHYVVSSLD